MAKNNSKKNETLKSNKKKENQMRNMGNRKFKINEHVPQSRKNVRMILKTNFRSTKEVNLEYIALFRIQMRKRRPERRGIGADECNFHDPRRRVGARS